MIGAGAACGSPFFFSREYPERLNFILKEVLVDPFAMVTSVKFVVPVVAILLSGFGSHTSFATGVHFGVEDALELVEDWLGIRDLFHFIPHALQYVSPEGPFLHRGVCTTAHLAHFLHLRCFLHSTAILVGIGEMDFL